MSLDVKLALNDVSFNKSDFNHIPVVASSTVGGHVFKSIMIQQGTAEGDD